MRLHEVADLFERLDATTGRNRVIALVADLLRRADGAEIPALVYLLQGQLRPPYEGVQLGLGQKLLQRAIATAYDASAASVARRFARAGDLGTCAAALAPVTARRRMSVREAYAVLLEIARISGAGALERKRTRLAGLLRGLDGPEARFVVRAAQGRLRAGVGDQTILAAAAVAALGGREGKPLLEHAYNVRSDLGEVVRVAFADGERGLAKMGPAVGVPIRPALAQRLASADAIVERLGEVQVEPKYDGFRLQLHRDGDRVWAFSRRLENVSGMFPDLALAVRRELALSRAIIEGEAVVHDPATGEFLPFQVTMTRKRKTGVAAMAERYPLRLFAFDLLYAGRRNYLPRPLRERARRLRALLPATDGEPVVVTDALVTDRASEVEAYFAEMLRRGLEGIVAKRLDAPYRAGARGYDWVKLKRASQSKLRDTVDAVLVGYLRGRGKRAALGIGSLLAAVYDPEHDRFRTIAKIGSGLSDAGWKEMRKRLDARATRTRPPRVDSLVTPDVWVEPTYVVEVLADEITRSPSHTCGKAGDAPGYALRFPRMVGGVRADKGPTDATTEREILDLYRLQRASAKTPAAGAGRSTRATRQRRARWSSARSDASGSVLATS